MRVDAPKRAYLNSRRRLLAKAKAKTKHSLKRDTTPNSRVNLL
jgi:hypothetical protein